MRAYIGPRQGINLRQALFARIFRGTMMLGGDSPPHLRWDLVIRVGPFIGYYAKPSKSWLIVKPGYLEYAKRVFARSGLQITTDGQRHLGAVVGSEQYRAEYVKMKIDGWIEEVEKLGEVARVDPHAAYCAYVFGLQHRYC